MEDNLEWIAELQNYSSYKLSSNENSINNPINVFFKYTPDVHGYDVYGRFLPFDYNVESGHAIFMFKNGDSAFTYTCDCWSDYYTNEIRDWQNNQVYEFKYIAPNNNDDKMGYDSSPLGYHAPFQFFDVDFDGKDEFITNDYYRGKGGNTYISYKIKTGKLHEMDYPPFNSISNATEFEVDKKQIVNHIWDGVYFHATIYYTRKNQSNNSVKSLPSFKTPILHENWNNCLLPRQPFTIDSIIENVGDTVLTYQRIGTILRHTGTRVNKKSQVIPMS